MKNNRTLKLLTLSVFIFLLTSFVAFKSGTFDRFLTTESSSSPILNQAQISKFGEMVVDTPPAKKADTMRINPRILPTSKSGILFDQEINFQVEDSLKKDNGQVTPKK